jgi:small-conductance mechanosensitive channel
MESLRTDSVVKVSVSTEVIEQQKHRIKQLEEELDSMTERATFLMDKSAEWDGLLGQAREMLERIQYSEVGQVFSGCSDLDSFLQNLQQNVRNA